MTVADDAVNWARLRLAFDEIVARDDAGRAAMLAEISASDPSLRAKLENLLEADASADDQLARLDRLFDQGAGRPDPLGLSGRTVGHFQVIAPLGSGGMGVVYRALDTNLGRAVALKFPLLHLSPDGQVIERFQREARAAAALDHPNVCSVHEAGQTSDGMLFLAMPFYDGETLKARLAREGSLPVRDAVDIGAQIARGLGAAHRAGIVHRDLKPANVMLLPDGGVKILDFGVARIMGAALTTAGGTPGTVAYMAPESVRGEGSDARSDLWSLGVLLYEMLTGERPFQHQVDIALMHAVLSNDPVRPSLLRQGITPQLEQLILSLLAKDPETRPESAERVLAGLASPDRTHAAFATPVNPAPRNAASAAAPRRRARLTAALVSAIVLPLVGVGIWFAQSVNGGHAAPRTVAVVPFNVADSDPFADGIGAALADAAANQLSRLTSVAVPDPQIVRWYAIAGGDAKRDSMPAFDVVTVTVERRAADLKVGIEMHDAKRQRRSTYGFTLAQAELHMALPRLLREVASGLQLDLRREERTLLAALPTANPDAWERYLRGRAIQLGKAPPPRASYVEGIREAQSLYATARELDPNFAFARARLAQIHMQIAEAYDTTVNRREQARFEAEAALRLDPGLPEAHVALMRYYRWQGDHARADTILQRALAAAPNRSDLRFYHATRLGDNGRWNEVVEELEKAIRLDPRNTLALRYAALTYSRLRRYTDGIAAWDRVIALDSSDVLARAIRGHQYLRLGISDSLAATAERMTLAQDDRKEAMYTRYTALRVQRRYGDALDVLDRTRQTSVGDGLFYRPIILLRALTLDEMGEPARAKLAYEAARVLLEDSVRARPRDAGIRIALGLAYAGLGRKADAVAEAQKAMEFTPLTTGTGINTAYMGEAVQVFIKAGAYDEAIQKIELLLTTMYAGREMSVPLLRLEPFFDPLRGDPRFQQLLDRFSRR